MSAQISNHGITLVALVITIIVLVILVGVTLSVTLNSGLMNNAKNAVADYNQAQREEEKSLAMLEAAMNTENNVVETGVISFTIYDSSTGETTRYEAESGMTWGHWLESDFNTDRLSLNFADPNPSRPPEPLEADRESWVYLDDVIISSGRYELRLSNYVILLKDPDIPEISDPDIPMEEPL